MRCDVKFQEFWNKSFETYSTDGKIYSSWLDKYVDAIDRCKTKALDLGCGVGYDSYYLTQKGLEVIACDFSEVALSRLKENVKDVETMLLDISEKLPFEDEAFDLVIADLSLHYFDTKTTEKIMAEIERILAPKGFLLARVNSIYDINHGAGEGEKIEDNFYFVKGYNKRFFSVEDAKKFFSIAGKTTIREEDMVYAAGRPARGLWVAQ